MKIHAEAGVFTKTLFVEYNDGSILFVSEYTVRHTIEVEPGVHLTETSFVFDDQEPFTNVCLFNHWIDVEHGNITDTNMPVHKVGA